MNAVGSISRSAAVISDRAADKSRGKSERREDWSRAVEKRCVKRACTHDREQYEPSSTLSTLATWTISHARWIPAAATSRRCQLSSVIRCESTNGIVDLRFRALYRTMRNACLFNVYDTKEIIDVIHVLRYDVNFCILLCIVFQQKHFLNILYLYYYYYRHSQYRFRRIFLAHSSYFKYSRIRIQRVCRVTK